MFGSKKKKAASLMESGTKAVGTIVGVRDTGMTINDNPRVVISFRIDPLDGGAAFPADKKVTVSRVSIPQAGQRFPVWFDPEDHSSFAYATISDDAGRAQIVSLFGDAFGPNAVGVGQPEMAATPAPAAPTAADPLEQIAKLNELRQAGALNDAEFEAQKARILS